MNVGLVLSLSELRQRLILVARVTGDRCPGPLSIVARLIVSLSAIIVTTRSDIIMASQSDIITSTISCDMRQLAMDNTWQHFLLYLPNSIVLRQKSPFSYMYIRLDQYALYSMS